MRIIKCDRCDKIVSSALHIYDVEVDNGLSQEPRKAEICSTCKIELTRWLDTPPPRAA